MERFVFVAAITFAIIWGVVAVIGRGDFNFHIDGDGIGVAPIVAVAPGRMEAQAFTGSDLEIKHAAAHITIVPEDRQDFLVEIDNSAGRAPMPNVTTEDGHVVIDGLLRGRVGSCLTGGGADLNGYGELALADLPRITVRAPRSIDLDLSGASTAEIGASQSLTLDFSGCGSASFADVAGDIAIDLAGSGDVRGGAGNALNADVAGSGRLTVGAIANGASIDLAGAGKVTIASLAGAFSTDGAGSGTVTVQGGAITNANIDLAGSGDVEIAAPVQDLSVSIMGSGDVDVQGVVGDLDAEIAGSGSVSALAVTGSSQREIMGSGEVRIGTITQTPDSSQNTP